MSAENPTNEELALRVINGDSEAMNLLYNQNVGLIVKQCKRAYAKCNLPDDAVFEEYDQEAALCFVESAPKYNPNLGYMFSTFISNCIYNHMVDYILKGIRLSQKEIHIVQKSDFGNCIKKTDGLLTDYWQRRLHIFSISAEKAYFKDYFNETIENALNLLSPRQMKLISFRFGLGGEEEYCSQHTIEEASEYFGISKRDVREIQKSSLRLMRRYCYQRLAYIVKKDDINADELISFVKENAGALPYIPEEILTREYQFDEPDAEQSPDESDDFYDDFDREYDGNDDGFADDYYDN